MYYLNGDRYEGEWREDKQNGVGTMYYADGSEKYGNWVDGVCQN